MFNHPMGGLYRWCMNGPDDETRATLLDAARTLLEADGPAALTVRRIAAEAGMSTMNVYSRFGGKDGVVDELYCEGFHRLREYVAKHAKSDDPVENFRAPGVAYRDFALENRTFYSVMFFRPIPGYVPSPRRAVSHSTVSTSSSPASASSWTPARSPAAIPTTWRPRTGRRVTATSGSRSAASGRSTSTGRRRSSLRSTRYA